MFEQRIKVIGIRDVEIGQKFQITQDGELINVKIFDEINPIFRRVSPADCPALFYNSVRGLINVEIHAVHDASNTPLEICRGTLVTIVP